MFKIKRPHYIRMDGTVLSWQYYHRQFKTKTEARNFATEILRWNSERIKVVRTRQKQKMPLRVTDAGREAFCRQTGVSESKDCTVRALACVTGFSYKWAHIVLQSAGRPWRRGFPMNPWIRRHSHGEVLHENGRSVTFTIVYDFLRTDERFTVNQFLKQRRVGRYLVVIAKHAMTVVDGVIHDTFASGGRSRIELIAKCEEVSPQ